MTETKIKRLLKSLGFKSNIEGYKFVVAALQVLHKQGGAVRANIMNIYSEVAHLYRTTTTAVEHSIRYGVEATLKMLPERDFERFGFSYNNHFRVTNLNFLCTVYDYIVVYMK